MTDQEIKNIIKLQESNDEQNILFATMHFVRFSSSDLEKYLNFLITDLKPIIERYAEIEKVFDFTIYTKLLIRKLNIRLVVNVYNIEGFFIPHFKCRMLEDNLPCLTPIVSHSFGKTDRIKVHPDKHKILINFLKEKLNEPTHKS